MPLPQEILEKLPEEFRENETLNRFNDVGDLAKSYLESRSMLGNAIRVPSEDAGEEDRKQFIEKVQKNAPELMLRPNFEDPEQSDDFYRLIGRPDEPDAYGLPEDVSLNDEVVNELKRVSHDVGLSEAQFKKMVKSLASQEAERQELLQTKIEEKTEELKKEWGVTYKDRIKAAERINEEYYPGRPFETLNPAEVQGLYKMHVALTGKDAPAANQGDQGDGMTPAEAEERYAEIMRKVRDPKSDLSREEQQRLIKKAMGLLTKYAGYSDSIDGLRAAR
jgi:hypothetical protein